MTNITIISDYGQKDHFVASLKGVLLQEVIDARFVDITHDIPPFNLKDAAYILSNSYLHFPKKTIHLLCVDEEPSEERPMIVVSFEGHYFIGVNNGLMSLVIQNRNDFEATQIDEKLLEGAESARDIFAKIAGHLSRGGKPGVLGRKCETLVKLNLLKPSTHSNDSGLSGVVMYIDHFGNVITNISKQLFDEIGKGRSFEIIIPGSRQPLTRILNSYREATNEGSSIAIFNSSGWLEIAIYKPGGKYNNGAHTLLGLDLNDRVTITFL